ncbi:MAG TPA: TRAP transporter small permease [Bacillota bacterium]|nr:TRAP transporter small permease [Bacillota bacterium]
MKKAKVILDKIHTNVLTIMFIIMVLVCFQQVISRYLLGNSLVWSEELSRYILTWIVFLGTGYVLGQGGHGSMDLLEMLPQNIRKVLSYISNLFVIIYSFIMIKYGIEFLLIGMRQKSSAMQIPMSIVYIALPLGGLMIMIYCLLSFFVAEGE